MFLPHERGLGEDPGAGLGLAIVEAHGGIIQLEPLPAGTSTVVKFPVEHHVTDEVGEGDGLAGNRGDLATEPLGARTGPPGPEPRPG
jgi:hypothetical protein